LIGKELYKSTRCVPFRSDGPCPPPVQNANCRDGAYARFILLRAALTKGQDYKLRNVGIVTQFTAQQTRNVTRGHAASIRGRETDSARLRERATMKRQGSVNHVEYLSRHEKRARTHICRIEHEALQGYARTQVAVRDARDGML
jgi:hypothetical protein